MAPENNGAAQAPSNTTKFPTPNEVKEAVENSSVQPTGETAQAGAETEEYDVERAKAKIAKVNSEAAELRKRLKVAEARAAELDAREEAEKTELQRLQDERDALKTQHAKAQDDLTRQRVASKFSLDPQLLDFIPTGLEEDELTEKVKYLASRVSPDQEFSPDYTQGTPGAEVTDHARLAKMLFG